MTLLDSSALVAFFLSEPGADKVEAKFADAALPLVNLAETLGVLHRKGVPLEQAEAGLLSIGVPFLPPTEEIALNAGRLSIHRGLSLGDRFCIAQAQALNAPVVTADRAWAAMSLPVSVELIR